MTARAAHRGHPIEWKGGKWRYTEGSQFNPKHERPCVHCGAVSDGPDSCLGTLGWVDAACCGHGDPDAAYFMFHDGSTLRGQDALDLKDIWVKNMVTPAQVIVVYLKTRSLKVTRFVCELVTDGWALEDLV